MLPQITGATYSNPAADETVVQVVASPQSRALQVYNLILFNPDATDASYVQFFDALTVNVTLGTTIPTFVVPLPASGGVQAGLYLPYGFGTALTYAVTATPTGSGAPASDAVVSLAYV